jgi:PKD repeat protein
MTRGHAQPGRMPFSGKLVVSVSIALVLVLIAGGISWLPKPAGIGVQRGAVVDAQFPRQLSTNLSVSALAYPASGPSPLTVSFDATISGGAPPYNSSWSFGDGSSGWGNSPTHVYSGSASYLATVTVRDALGEFASASTNVTVSSGPFSLTAEATPNVGLAPLTTSMSATASGGTPPYTYNWTLGDGFTASGESISHTYSAPANYWVDVSARDGVGQVAQYSFQVFVSFSVSITATPVQGTAPLTVQLTVSASGGATPYSYAWKFGDGGLGSGPTITHVYSAVGSYYATVTVTDAAGYEVNSSVNVDVSGTSFSVVAGASPLSGPAPLSTTLIANASGEPSPILYSWAFGDGSNATGPLVHHTYQLAGVYTATVTATAPSGQTASYWLQIVVNNASGGMPNPLQVTISTLNATGPAPLGVLLNASVTGGAGPYFYTWKFGDGYLGSGASILHRYLSPGTYTAAVYVSDNAGHENVATTVVTAYPSSNSTGPNGTQVSISASPTTGPAPLSTVLHGFAHGGTPPYTFVWSFGDGASGSGPVVNHTYASPGSYEASLTVTDAFGDPAYASVLILATGDNGSEVSGLSLSVSTASARGVVPFSTNFFPSIAGGVYPYSLSWDFGDGSPQAVSVGSDSVHHTYVSSGMYALAVRVTDAQGKVAVWTSTAAGVPSVNVLKAGATGPTGGWLTNPDFSVALALVVVAGSTTVLFVRTRRRGEMQSPQSRGESPPATDALPSYGKYHSRAGGLPSPRSAVGNSDVVANSSSETDPLDSLL